MFRRAESIGAPYARGLAALGFVMISIAALVAVPWYYGQEVEDVMERIADVQPVDSTSSALRLIRARQMARAERFLATRDPLLRLNYNAAVGREDTLQVQLRRLAEELDEGIESDAQSDGAATGADEEASREAGEIVAAPDRATGPEPDQELLEETFETRVARINSASAAWHVLIDGIFNPPQGDIDPPADPALVRSRLWDRYEEVEAAMGGLDMAIQERIERELRTAGDLRERQGRVTYGLALLALVATLIVTRMAYRYRGLTIQSEQRRRDAVRARREAAAVLEATGEGVLGIDLEGRCTSLNQAGEQLLGFTESQLSGRDVHETLFHTRPDGSPAPRQESDVLEAIGAGRPLESGEDAIMWRRKGVSFPVRWSLRPMIDGRQLRGAVLTFNDMTETLQRQQQLRRAIRQREDVVSIVSHDLRNPLGVTLAAADLLLDLPLDEGQRRRQAQIIRRSGHRMQRLIDDLLDVSRIEEGALVVRVARENLQLILEEAAELFLHQAQAKSLRLTVVEPEGDLTARVDRDRILQALSNLLDNAIRVTPEGGSVTLSAWDDGAQVAVAVEDTGPGIAPEALETLFDRFAQSDSADRGAAGLGLTIVRGVASAHGGDVSVSTELGKGSRFVLRLPRERNEGE